MLFFTGQEFRLRPLFVQFMVQTPKNWSGFCARWYNNAHNKEAVAQIRVRRPLCFSLLRFNPLDLLADLVELLLARHVRDADHVEADVAAGGF